MSSSSPLSSCDGTAHPEAVADLLVALAEVPDPRRTGARRHPTAYVLGVLVLAYGSAGFESLAAAAQWAKAAPGALLRQLGARPCPLTGRVVPPSEATLGRVVRDVDHEFLERIIATWTRALLEPTAGEEAAGEEAAGEEAAGEQPVIAIDGKTVRGAHDGDQPAPHLLAASTHPTDSRPAVVLTQRRIPSKTNEIPEVRPLIDDLRAAGHNPAEAVFTLDALHTQRATAHLLHDQGAGYLMTVKANQPTLLDTVSRTAWPTPTRDHFRGHGRTTEHLIQVAPVPDGIDFPGAAQVFRLVRYTGGLDGQRTTKEVVHGITNLAADQADPSRLTALARGHWSIESIHWVRDVTLSEDASRVRRGNGPAVLAAIRNVVMTALRVAGATNLAAARRATALNPYAMLTMLKPPPNRDKHPL